MKLMRLASVAACAGMLMGGLGLVGSAHAQGFADDSFSIHDNPDSKQPGVSPDIDKLILNFTHVDGGKNYIDNFFTIDLLNSLSHVDTAGADNSGAVEVYGIYRGDISFSKFTGSPVTIGNVIRDISLQFGGDFNTEDRAFESTKRLLVVGPNFHFNVPNGFFNFAVHFDQEWGHNGIVGKDVQYDPTGEFEAAWSIGLPVGAPLSLDGFANVVLPKGKDGFGAQTVTELLFNAKLNLDAGAVMFHKPHVLDAYVGFQYWLNKFGGDHTKVTGSLESTPFFGLTIHL